MATNFYKQGGSYYTTAGQKILNPTELQGYAKTGGKEIQAPQIPTGATKIAGPSGLQGLTESQIYRSGTDIYKLPSIPTQVSGDQLTGGVPNVPVVEPTQVDTTPFVAGLETGQKGFESLIKTIITPTQTESKVTPITQKITELTGGFENKPVDYQAQLDQYGFKTNVQDLQNLNTQIAATKAQYDKLTQAEEGRKGLAGSIYGRQALAQRQAAIELGGLSSMAQALQGNVQMAMDIADKTIAIKYEPLEKQIEDQKFQLEQVYDQLGREEKRKADALNIALDERQRKIDEQKEVDKQINEVMLTAAENGADSVTLQNILRAKTVDQAINSASGFLAKTGSSPLKFIAGTANQPAGYFNELTGEFIPLSGATPIDQAALDKANSIVGLVNEISGLNLGGVTGLVGGRLNVTPNQILADSKIKQLTGLLTLDNMGIMKGVLSDSDIKIIKEASTSLKRTLSENDFRAELQKIKNTSDRVIAGNEILSADPTRADELRRIMNDQPTITGDELRQLYGLVGFNPVGGDTNNSLGSLSAPYESGGDPKAIGYDTTGGHSYGTYQLTKGNIPKFLNVLETIPMFKTIVDSLKVYKVGSDAFNKLWKKAVDANPQAFKQAEEKYIESTHYQPQVKKLEESGVNLNKYSNVLKQVIWSTAVQHGPATSIIANAYKSLSKLLKREPNEQELIAKIYNDRWSNGANFKSSTPEVRKSVFNRFQNELKTALSKLNRA